MEVASLKREWLEVACLMVMLQRGGQFNGGRIVLLQRRPV